MSLRDGIASLLDAKFPIDRVRNGFDCALFDELAAGGVFTLRRDGFAWSDCAVVFEQLGRFCVPGPLVPSLLLGDGRIAAIVDSWVEFADVVDVVIVPAEGACAPGDLELEASSWPLDPATPVARVVNRAPVQPLAID